MVEKNIQIMEKYIDLHSYLEENNIYIINSFLYLNTSDSANDTVGL